MNKLPFKDCSNSVCSRIFKEMEEKIVKLNEELKKVNEEKKFYAEQMTDLLRPKSRLNPPT